MLHGPIIPNSKTLQIPLIAPELFCMMVQDQTTSVMNYYIVFGQFLIDF